MSVCFSSSFELFLNEAESTQIEKIKDEEGLVTNFLIDNLYEKCGGCGSEKSWGGGDGGGARRED